jgi:hypothetical protein
MRKGKKKSIISVVHLMALSACSKGGLIGLIIAFVV